MENKVKRKTREKYVKAKVEIEKNQDKKIIKPFKKIKDFLGKFDKRNKRVLKFDNLKLVYFPINKNASSYLLELFDYLENKKTRKFGFNLERHDFYKNKYGLKSGKKIPKEYIKVAFVRNPYERILSAYINRIKIAQEKRRIKEVCGKVLIKDFTKILVLMSLLK